MKKFFVFAVLIFASVIASGQTITEQQINFPLTSPPVSVSGISAYSRAGTSGSCTFFYWIVGNFTIGNGPVSGPARVNNSPCTPNVVINWSIPQQPPATYDVLRTTTSTPPSGACACAVATGVTATTQTDTSATTLAYTVTTFDPSTVLLTMQNEAVSAGVSSLTMRRGGPTGTQVFAMLSTGALGWTNPSGSATQILNMQDLSPNAAPFTMWIDSTGTFSGVKDPVMAIGYNVNSGGGRMTNTQPSFGWTIEGDYSPVPGAHVFESYFQFTCPAAICGSAIQLRPLFIQIDRLTGTMNQFVIASSGVIFQDWSNPASATFANLNKHSFSINGDVAQAEDSSIVCAAKNGFRCSLFLQGGFLIDPLGAGNFCLRVGTNCPIHIFNTAVTFNDAFLGGFISAQPFDDRTVLALQLSAGQISPFLNLTNSSGNLLGRINASGQLSMQSLGVRLISTNTLSSVVPVKNDTGNASQVVSTVTTDTGAGVVLGVCQTQPLAGQQCDVATSGIAAMTLGTGTCSIGNFVIVDTTTNGRVKCTAVYTAGTVIGLALQAQNTVGNTFNVQVGLR